MKTCTEDRLQFDMGKSYCHNQHMPTIISNLMGNLFIFCFWCTAKWTECFFTINHINVLDKKWTRTYDNQLFCFPWTTTNFTNKNQKIFTTSTNTKSNDHTTKNDNRFSNFRLKNVSYIIHATALKRDDTVLPILA